MELEQAVAGGDGVSIPVLGEGGYFMINTDDPTLALSDGEGEGQGEEAAYSLVPASRATTAGKKYTVTPGNRPHYENAPILQQPPGVGVHNQMTIRKKDRIRKEDNFYGT